MKKTINIVLILFSFIFLHNCDEEEFESSLKYVAFGDSTYSTGVDEDGSASLSVDVFTSSELSSDTTFNISIDSENAADGSFSVPSSVVIPSGSNKGSFTIALTDTNLGIGINRLVLSFSDVATGFDNGNSTTIEYFQNCTEVDATLDLTFDRWGSEVSWDIKDALGGVVASGGGYSDTGSGTSTSDTKTFTLCFGRSYTFTAYDAFGDGWGAVGSYALTVDGNIKASGPLGTFESSEATEFNVD
jgi:hypothetical protein